MEHHFNFGRTSEMKENNSVLSFSVVLNGLAGIDVPGTRSFRRNGGTTPFHVASVERELCTFWGERQYERRFFLCNMFVILPEFRRHRGFYLRTISTSDFKG